MNAKIINIGNSAGIIIPTKLLRKLDISIKSSVELEVVNGALVITPTPRQGWESAAQQMHAANDDMPLLVESLTEFDEEEWTW